MADDAELEQKGKISFVFSKKTEKKTLEQSTIGEESVKKKEETDFVTALEGKEVKSTKPQEKPKDLVIPLITKNRWNTKEEAPDGEGGKADSLDNEAVKELIEDAAKQQEKWNERGSGDPNLAIPLLMRNKIPEGYETDDRLDTSLRPNEASEADYEQVPIEQYGLAMLRGMGWKPGEAIGGKFKQVSAPVEAVLRPKGLGLGADRKPGDELKKKKPIKPGDKREEEVAQGFAKGISVLVTSGPHKNLYGKIEGVDEDNSRILIRLAISNQTANVSQYAAKIVSQKEYKKYSLDISRLSKAHQDKEENGREERDSPNRDRGEDRHRYRDRDKYGDRSRDRDRERHRDNDERDRDRHRDKRKRKSDYPEGKDVSPHMKSTDKDRHRDRRKEEETTAYKKTKHKDERYSPSTTSSHSASHGGQGSYWLRPELRVRIIDQKYKKGRYYNTKVVIVDVVTRDSCSCRTDDDKLLEDLKQEMLETLIPKADPGHVMIVTGKYKGQVGTILKKDKANCIAHVELLSDRSKIKKLDYDSICEYVGNIQEEQDY
ncbi:G-patch domain and KOW motifs-containing protein-like [Ptychodera flava]|uniref:G-patch domain and KOW motifs-containing protein-like n=1 Tax=Ptychodera flava TaxID=63121 RepID=UPI00396A91FC